ncbi:MAG TPA: type II toxin-antitoxin system VapC family toxin [Pyrinomonadaceae bacterium]|nr:type II toxin-antitoxin system VapC family toxin [Pyrinomonadaceae bacterium]
MIYVLDACAMLAYLRNEAGADVVESALLDTNSQCVAHAVNLCEVYYIVHRDNGESDADSAIAGLNNIGVIERDDLDETFWKAVGRLKAGGGISIPDCFAITLSNKLGGTVLTSDHKEFDPIAAAGVCSVTFIR